LRLPLIGALIISGIVLSSAAQIPAPVTSQWSAESRRQAENLVAAKLESMRAAAKLSKLHRVRPSVAEVQLVCTAARTGNQAYDPAFGGLETYVTGDLSAEAEELKVIAFGTSRNTEGESRSRVYSDKDWSHFSVIVELNGRSTPDSPLYTVGIARRQSAWMEFLGSLTFDHPIKDKIDWKNQVDPACRAENP
jgi:hypothetical protein